ncbi:MAG: hypothetical protein M0P51_00235 [Methanoculleus sp.]|nr:hypothetical protein [Methanoculleus sp.]
MYYNILHNSILLAKFICDPRDRVGEVIEIQQQKMAIVLTVVIQALVIGGLIACIVVGTQDPLSSASPAGEIRHMEYGSWSTSPAAYPIVGHPPVVRQMDIAADRGEDISPF